MNFGVDIGGLVELFPTRRTVLRVGFSGQLVRFARESQDPEWTRNQVITAGAGMRF
jgi:hypothetical protein